jgi:pimeloyl-ACP methyl ester carboxylesterase
MSAQATRAQVAPPWGELRYSGELARLLAQMALRGPRRAIDGQPVLLIPGFMAGDSSLAVLRRWLERRGHSVSMSGMRANVDCAERIVGRLQARVQALASEARRPVCVIGQSRGGAIARCVAVRSPEAVGGLVMLGTPVSDPLAISAPVKRAAALLARLGDVGLPGMFSSSCRDGDCCAEVRHELVAPLRPHIRAVAVYSRSDGVVDWRACLDPHAEAVEVRSSHCGMSVHTEVYELLERVLDGEAASPGSRSRAGERHQRAPRSTAEASG